MERIASMEGAGRVFRALRYRNYRLYFGGQSISLVGTWMQMAAQQWLVYRLTGSASLLGLLGFLGHVPSLVVGPLAGLVLDRVDRRRVYLATQILAMTLAFVLAWLVLGGLVRVDHVLVLAFLLGVVNAFDMPTRHAFVIDLVERREDFGNAIALNSTLFHGARMVGPPLAGLVIRIAGEGWCFLVNGLSYLAIIGTLTRMRTAVRPRPNKGPGILASLGEGIRYAFGTPRIRPLLLHIMMVSLLTMPYMTIVPVFVKVALGGGSGTFGLLMGAAGMGALAGAFFLASLADARPLRHIIPIATAGAGASFLLMPSAHSLAVVLPLMACAGFCLMAQFASTNTMLQTLVDDEKRGRVMSLYTTSFAGLMPFGNLLLGAFAEHAGSGAALRFCGVSAVIAAGLFVMRYRRIEQEA